MLADKIDRVPRSYTLAEIDRMREAIRWSYPDGTAFYPEERNSDIENRLRTYIIVGISPEELEKHVVNKFYGDSNVTSDPQMTNKTMPTSIDEEFLAMSKILKTLLPFDEKQTRRILEWAASKSFKNRKRIIWK